MSNFSHRLKKVGVFVGTKSWVWTRLASSTVCSPAFSSPPDIFQVLLAATVRVPHSRFYERRGQRTVGVPISTRTFERGTEVKNRKLDELLPFRGNRQIP